jgi:hypothetical protein
MTMPTTSIALPASRFARPSVRALVALVIVLLGLLYFEWKTSRAAPMSGAREADTMCIAARIGLSCR